MTDTAPKKGRLLLVPAPLDFGEQAVPLEQVLPAHTLQTAAGLSHWICENAKSARAYLKRIDALYPLAQAMQALHIQELPREVHKKGDHDAHRNNVGFDPATLLAPALAGHDVGLLSEAGMPAVADPGASVVRAAHDLGLSVVPLVGPVSLLLALAASGLSGQNFAFVGYLPTDAIQRAQRIKALESLALKTGQTQIFIETPYRNSALLQALLQHLEHSTRLSVSWGLTLPQARTLSASVKAFKRATDLPNDRPAVFAIGR